MFGIFVGQTFKLVKQTVSMHALSTHNVSTHCSASVAHYYLLAVTLVAGIMVNTSFLKECVNPAPACEGPDRAPWTRHTRLHNEHLMGGCLLTCRMGGGAFDIVAGPEYTHCRIKKSPQHTAAARSRYVYAPVMLDCKFVVLWLRMEPCTFSTGTPHWWSSNFLLTCMLLPPPPFVCAVCTLSQPSARVATDYLFVSHSSSSSRAYRALRSTSAGPWRYEAGTVRKLLGSLWSHCCGAAAGHSICTFGIVLPL